MPLVKARNITPDAALAQDLCPECGGDLQESNAVAHLNNHWRLEPPAGSDGDEARRRRALLRNYVKSHNIKTSDQLEAEAATAKAAGTIEPAA